MRMFEFYNKLTLSHDYAISNTPKKMYPQERDWTCSIACIRTILSGIDPTVPSEEEFIKLHHLQPGPFFSKDIRALNILKDYDVIYGSECTGITFDQVLSYMENGYYIMVESMMNFSHWFVLLGYYPDSSLDVEEGKILVYDPYYNRIRLLILDEFIQMWLDGNHNINRVTKDFIAIRKKTAE